MGTIARRIAPVLSAALLSAYPLAGVAQTALATVADLAPGGEPLAAASDGASYLVVWEESEAIWGYTVGLDGSIGAAPFQIGASSTSALQANPAVAAGSGGFLVVWAERADVTADWNIFGATVIGGVPGLPFSVSTALDEQQYPAVASVGSDFLVVWQDGRADPLAPDIFGALVHGDGFVATPDGLAISQLPGAQRRPSVAANAADYLVVWEDTPPSATADIFGILVTASGEPATAFAISTAAQDQLEPVVTSDGFGWLVAWNDFQNGVWELWAARANGSAVVGSAMNVATVGAGAPHAVASDGNGYVLVYEPPTSGAVGRRIPASGSPGAEFPIQTTNVVAPGQAIVSGGSGAYLEVHRQNVSGDVLLASALITTLETLQVSVAGTGSGAVTSLPAGIDCGTVCAGDYQTGTEVTLTATPNAGSTFASWTGCPSAAGNTCTVTTAAPVAVTATFSLEAPAAPGLPTYADVTSTSLSVAWSSAAGATSYRVERAQDDSGSPGAWVEVTAGETGTSHADSGLGPYTTYWYRVRGTNAETDGPYSSATTITTAPGAASALTFTSVGSTTLTVSWTAPASGAATYDVDRAPDVSGAPGPFAPVVTAITGLSWSETGLTAGTKYWYRIRAANADGAGTYSAHASVLTVAGAPGAPTFSSVGASAVTASWPAVTGATSYALERAPDVSGVAGTWTETAAGIVGTSRTDGPLAANTRYWYRVRATNGSGEGEPSIASDVVTLPGAPDAPTFSGWSASSVTVSWNAPTGGATTYELERALDASGTPGAFTTVVSGTNSLLHADSGLFAGTSYWYRLRAANATGAGAFSSPALTTTLPGTAAAPGFTSVTAGSVTVTWTAVAGATSYRVERAPDVGGAAGIWTQIVAGVAGTSYGDESLAANTGYWYRIGASNAGGDGGLSSESSVTTKPGVPSAPMFSGVTASAVEVSWTPPLGGAPAFRLERSTAGGPWSEIVAGLSATSHLDVGLSGNVEYRYRVRATNGSGDGEYSSESAVTTLPEGPGAPAFSSVTTTSVVVSWSAPAGGASTYEVERATASNGPFSGIASGVAGLAFADSGLSGGTTYWYRVRAVNAGGSPGAYSVASSVLTRPAAPDAPTFSAVAPTTVTVGWTTVTGATSYRVERAAGSGGPWTQLTPGVASPTFVSNGLSGNTTYWYRVVASNASGDGPYSGASTVTTPPGSPGAPSFSAVTTTTVTVSWAAPGGGAASYDVFRGSSATGPWTSVATGVTGLSAPSTGLTEGTTYWYVVRAINAVGGTDSPVSQIITLPGVPGVPTFTNVAATSVTVGWGAAAGAASYKVERAPDNGSGAPGTWTQVIAGLSATEYPSTGLTANRTYWYRVRATNASGDGTYSSPASVITLPNPPGGPTFSNVTTTSLTVSWTAPPTGAASYELQRGTSANGPSWTTLLAPTTALTFADAGLTAGTTYWYRVRAANSDGLWSAYSIASVPTLPEAPAAPSFVDVTTTTLTVEWTAVTGATSYKVERAPDDGTGAAGPWTQIAAGVAAIVHPDTGLTANTTYWYRLRATNESGDSAYSVESRVVTLANAPAKPTFTSVGTTSLTVSWTVPPNGAVSYDVERSLTGTSSWIQIATGVTALSHGDSGLTPGTVYWYRVRAANVADARSAWSSSASVITLPAAPGWATPTFTQVSTVSWTVNWIATGGVTTYQLERALDVSGAPSTTWELVAAGLIDLYFNDVGAPNTIYWYRVRGVNASGPGDWSLQTSVASAANAPGTPTFTNVTPTSVTVSWTAPAGDAPSYDVERATSITGPWTLAVSGVTTLAYADTGLSPNTTYWYRIRSTNSPPGWYSPVNSVRTPVLAPSSAPGAPTFSAVQTTGVTVSWTAATGATSYELERAPDALGVPGAWAQVAAPSPRTFTDTGLAANTRYWYRVRGSSAGGDGPDSPASSVVTRPEAPGAMTFSAVTATALNVSWTEPPGGAAAYRIERATSAAGPWTLLASGLSGPTYADSGLTANTEYHYRVRGANALGLEGAYSAVASVTTSADGITSPPGAPGAPTYPSIAATTVRVAWTAGSGAATYELERAPDAGGAPGAWAQIATLSALSYLDAGRAPNTPYWYRVRASNLGGESASSTPTSVMTAPNAPGAPAFASVTATTLTVAWIAPVGGAATYQLERASSSVGPWVQRSTGLSATRLDDAGLAGNTVYYYRVRAVNAAGVGGLYSAARSVVTPADGSTTPPGAPGSPAFTSIGATSVRVSWGAVTSASSYLLERTASVGGLWTQVAATTATSFTDTGRNPNTTYWYRVRASNGGGYGAYSPTGSVTTAPYAPGAPAFSSVGSTSVTVSWTAPQAGAATYKLERATSVIGPWTMVASGVVGVTRADAGLSANTRYHYRVRATNAAGTDGPYSATGSVTTAADPTVPPPSAPDVPTFSSIGATSVKVTWAAAAGAMSYRLERASSPAGPWTPVATVTTTSLTDVSRSPNTSYTYRVCGTNGGGDGAYSQPASVITAPYAPGAPTFSSIQSAQVVVSWASPVGGAATYKVERAASSIGPWGQIAAGIPTSFFADTAVTGNATYFYRVRATNSVGVDGTYSGIRSVVTAADAAATLPGAPGTPTFSNVLSSSLRVSWSAAVGATSYRVERAPASTGTWGQVTATTATSFTDAGRAANTTYWYRVRASNAAGEGPYSGEVGAMTAPGVPGVPTFPSVATTSVTVGWTAPLGGAATYKLERATSAVGPWAQVASGVATTSRSDAGLAPYSLYYYRVRATNAMGGDGIVSSSASVRTLPETTVALPGAPGTPTFSSIAASWLKVSWTPATGATSYRLERATASGGPWTQIAAPTSTSFSDTGRLANTRYWYRVLGTNAGGDGVYSAADDVVTAPNAPGAPTFTSVTASGVSIAWTAPAGGAASYRVERAASSLGPWSEIAAGITGLGHADTGLTAGTTYFYRMRGTNVDGTSGAYSLIRSISTAAAPGL